MNSIFKFLILFIFVLSTNIFAVSLSDLAYHSIAIKHYNGQKIEEGLFSRVSVIKKPTSYNGSLVFVDSLESVTDDFAEPLTPNNALFVREIDTAGNDLKLWFPQRIRRNPFVLENKKYTSKDDINSCFDESFDFVSATNLHVGGLKVTTKKKFLSREDFFSDDSMDLVGDINKEFELLVKDKNCQTINKISLSFQPTYFSLERLDQDNYGLLVQYNHKYEFRRRLLKDDLLFVLDKYGLVDGSYKIENRFYSPRLNVVSLFSEKQLDNRGKG